MKKKDRKLGLFLFFEGTLLWVVFAAKVACERLFTIGFVDGHMALGQCGVLRVLELP